MRRGAEEPIDSAASIGCNTMLFNSIPALADESRRSSTNTSIISFHSFFV